LFPPEPDVFARTAAQAIHYLVSIVSHVLVVGALLMMAAQRLQRQLEDRNADLEAARTEAEEAIRPPLHPFSRLRLSREFNDLDALNVDSA
jgi:hypothetical protein